MPRAKKPTLDVRLKKVGLFLKGEGLDIAWDRSDNYVRISYRDRDWELEEREAKRVLNLIMLYYMEFEEMVGKDKRKIDVRKECCALLIARKWLKEKGEWNHE